jgi:MarR family 2-MHQ and catechol resistance regulon transcriptional repressor
LNEINAAAETTLMATRYPGSRRERLALDIFIRLNRAAEAVGQRAIDRAPLPEGLTTPQFGVLEALLHLGPMCQAELGRKLLKTKGNVSLVVDNLANRGLVERRPSEADRRQREVVLTEEGESLIRDYFPHHARALTEEMSVLSEQEQRQLGELCRKVGFGRGVTNSTSSAQTDERNPSF